MGVVVFVALLAAAGLLCRKKLPACWWHAGGMPLYRAATNPFSGWWQEKHKTIIKSGGEDLNMSELAPDDGALIHADATILTYVAEGKEEEVKKEVTDIEEAKEEKVEEVKDEEKKIEEKKDTGTPV